MTPEPFTGVNTMMKAPENWNEAQLGPCHDMPVFIGNGIVLSTWRPSEEEIALLVGGGSVLLTVAGTNMPPVQVEVVRRSALDGGMAQA